MLRTWRGAQPLLQPQQPQQQQQQHAMFPYALYGILYDDSNASWISWSTDGSNFSIRSWDNLTTGHQAYSFTTTRSASTMSVDTSQTLRARSGQHTSTSASTNMNMKVMFLYREKILAQKQVRPHIAPFSSS
ncbi:hypothetical protein DL89DRAFT_298713 [Linderina pennispora]|uniref:Uncharacterized protein n=1 Tax=Linderina pennispora TaxID=61395 RepID=A0A1Y1WJD6_9FUNG|nr:uncharacterized protein DL89DRAFT_298713 [Linderina pennispora]ORX73603.1 hypothetical protein DL89DRAFT_298713 [Linderina pennispora]